jgi:hypothetical protein
MDCLAWLECQYRALVVREGQLLDSMLVLLQVGHEKGPLYAELEEELDTVSLHQSAVARSIRVALGIADPLASAPRGAWSRPVRAPGARGAGKGSLQARHGQSSSGLIPGRERSRAAGSWPPVAS